MKKLIILILILLLIFTGCTSNDIKSLKDEPIKTFEVSKIQPTATSTSTSIPNEISLDTKFAKIDFSIVSCIPDLM